jgi:hypothetical protein
MRTLDEQPKAVRRLVLALGVAAAALSACVPL